MPSCAAQARHEAKPAVVKPCPKLTAAVESTCFTKMFAAVWQKTFAMVQQPMVFGTLPRAIEILLVRCMILERERERTQPAYF